MLLRLLYKLLPLIVHEAVEAIKQKREQKKIVEQITEDNGNNNDKR